MSRKPDHNNGIIMQPQNRHPEWCRGTDTDTDCCILGNDDVLCILWLRQGTLGKGYLVTSFSVWLCPVEISDSDKYITSLSCPYMSLTSWPPIKTDRALNAVKPGVQLRESLPILLPSPKPLMSETLWSHDSVAIIIHQTAFRNTEAEVAFHFHFM